MKYTLVATPAAERVLRKLPEAVRKHLFKELEILETQPFVGERLKGKLRFLRSLHTRHLNTDYRVVYEILERNKEICVHYTSTRENFYREVERLRLKSLKAA